MKVKKNIVITVLMLVISSLVGCTKYENFSNDVKNFEESVYIVENNEPLMIDVEEIFKNSEIDITKYEITCTNEEIVEIKNNKVTSLKSGISNLNINLYEKKTKTMYSTSLGKVYSIMEGDFTKINTVEDLVDMQEIRSGNYLLNSDIDLLGLDWKPIGDTSIGNQFMGMFVNLDGYKIKNLTIDLTKDSYHGPHRESSLGLFGSTKNSLFYGLELENVNLDGSDSLTSITSGGISASSLDDTFYKCKVDGNIVSSGNCGGIVGSTSWSNIIDCEFEGNVSSVRVKGSSTFQVGSGGIAGYSGGANIINCNVNAQLASYLYSGYIVGIYEKFDGCLKDNVYTGKILSGENNGKFGYSRV